MSDLIELSCSCAEIAGEDPGCPLHGVTIERAAAWSDNDCLIDPGTDAFTVRRLARQAADEIARLSAKNERMREALETARDYVADLVGSNSTYVYTSKKANDAMREQAERDLAKIDEALGDKP